MKFSKFHIIAFLSGASVMILEILGSRILAPYVGTSLFTWTSIIGTFLAGLSVGYHYGGKIADKYPTTKHLSMVFIAASLTTFMIPLLLVPILGANLSFGSLTNVLSIAFSFALFFLPSLFLGMVSPYLIRLTTQSVNTSGHTSGNIFAVSTIGSIIGTFSAGFILIPLLGVSTIILFVGLILGGISVFLSINMKKFTFLVSIFFLISLVTIIYSSTFVEENSLLTYDSPYYQIKVVEAEGAKMLLLDRQRAGALSLEGEDLFFHYTKYTKILKYLKPDSKEMLFVGAGACTEQTWILENTNSNVDTIEIDPDLFKVCEDHFNYVPSERTKEIGVDGRLYLNTFQKEYDVIRMDAFRSHFNIPFHLTTIETVKGVKTNLKEDGIVLINVIASIDGPASKFFKSELKTYSQEFENIYVFARFPEKRDQIQNIVVFISDEELDLPQTLSENEEISYLLDHYLGSIDYSDGIVLTDEYSPVESMFLALTG